MGTWNYRSNIVDTTSLDCSNVVGRGSNSIGCGGWHCLGSNTGGNRQGVGERISSIGNWGHSSNWSSYGFLMNIGFSGNLFMDIRKSSWGFCFHFSYIGFSSNFFMNIGFSSNFFMNIGFSFNLFMDIRLSSYFLMDIRKGFWSNILFLRSWGSSRKSNKTQGQLKCRFCIFFYIYIFFIEFFL